MLNQSIQVTSRQTNEQINRLFCFFNELRLLIVNDNQGLFITTRDVILEKSIKLFAKYGFDGVSIRKICEKAGCNVSAISYHFGSKDELYRACLKEAGASILHLIERILTPPTSKEDFKLKLNLFLIEHFADAVRKRDLILIVSKDVNSKVAMGSINDIFQKIPILINEFFMAAQKNGLIRNDLQPALLGDLFLNPIFMQVLFADRNANKVDVFDPEYQKKYVSHQIDVILNGLS